MGSASLCSDELKNAVTQTQEEDNLSSANTVIMDPEEGPEDHELELADTQVLTDYNDNCKIVIEPPKSPSQRHLPWSRKLSQSQLTKVSTKVIVEHSDSLVSQNMESCFLSCCDDKDVPLRSPLKKSPSHKRKLVQSSQVVSDSLSSEGVTKETKDDSPDLLYPTPPDQTNKRKRKTSEGVSQDCCPLCGKKMSFKALLKHTPEKEKDFRRCVPGLLSTMWEKNVFQSFVEAHSRLLWRHQDQGSILCTKELEASTECLLKYFFL